TCYDNDGGDCDPSVCGDGECASDEDADSCPADCAPTEACSDCEFDFTNYGSECCDTAWDEYGINCATLEASYNWDCSGCACPGDGDPACGDGACNGDETNETCPEDCPTCEEAGGVEDCSGDGDCCPASWIGDGFEDCEDQAYGCDLTCYDNDGGDCGDDGGESCDEGYVQDCVDDDCCPESYIGDGYGDCEDQAYGCDLTCYDEDGGDCDDGGDTGGSEECSDCEYDFTAYGSECCDTAADAFGIDCATLESNYFWDCSGCNCPLDGDEPEGCAEGTVEDCSGDGDCAPESWVGDGWCDGTDQPYGYDLTCYDEDGGDCAAAPSCGDDQFDCYGDGTECIPASYYCDGSSEFCNAGWGPDCSNGADEGLETCGYADDCVADPTCADTGCGYWLNYGYDCASLSGWGYDCGLCEAEGACPTGCSDDQYECSDGSCIPASWECDIYWCDCSDCGDEADCGGRATSDNSMPRKGTVEFKMMSIAADKMINVKASSTKLDPISKVSQIVEKDRSLPVYTKSVDTKPVVKNSSRFMIKSIMKDVKNPADVVKPEASLNRKATGFESKLQRAESVKLIQTAEGLRHEADGYVGYEITLSHGADFTINVTESSFIADYKTTGNTTKVIVVGPETEALFSSTGDYEIVDVIAGTTGGTALTADIVSIPTVFGLGDAYPNPFNPSTSVELALPADGMVSVKVFNLMGQVVATLHEGHLAANTYSFTWNGVDAASGMYILQAEAAGTVDVQKIVLMK
ncbi:MAG: T9SS type A sorting domain-containing protein, partial [Candidatus Marinimicrobia bacterium]|nr:T9SS type A sorting domain-containing protein [Candidatus Neomarinimicrobiota bacterium]